LNPDIDFSNLAHQNEFMNIAGHISKLLYYNDCVIIPGLGGFVTDYAPAKIHPNTHTFFPPSKSVLFNSKLTNDDGILMHFIAREEKISYADAKREINYFVQDLIFELDKGKEAVLEKIGGFSNTPEGTFSFNPDASVNYLEASYGLPTFISPAISRKSIHKRFEKKFIDRKHVPDSIRKDRKIYWAYITIIPIVLIVGWFIFMNGYNNRNAQQTGVITITDSDIESPVGVDKPNDKNDKITKPLKDLNFNDSSQSSKEKDDLVTSAKDSRIAAKSRTKSSKYYIIGGAFQYKDNADKLVGTLRENGYNAMPAGINAKGLHLVSYFNSEDKAEALVNLAMIRRDSNPSAWLLKK